MTLNELKNLEGTKAERKKLWQLCEEKKLKYVDAVMILRYWSKRKNKDTLIDEIGKAQFTEIFGNTPEVVKQSEELFG